jgi:hypothetical protein
MSIKRVITINTETLDFMVGGECPYTHKKISKIQKYSEQIYRMYDDNDMLLSELCYVPVIAIYQ